MPSPHSELNGLLVVDKPGRPFVAVAHNDSDVVAPPAPLALPSTERFLTSHDVVTRVRRMCGQKRIGHTGTLDPIASGVLVLCLGNATRLVEYYQGEDKTYLAEVTLGEATDSYDIEGAVTAQAAVPELDQMMLETALRQFCGDILQQPPAFAAIKQGGTPMYVKARRGETVATPPRQVTFHDIELVAWDAPYRRLILRVKSSAGAYIRSLAHDLGLALGTYGHLTGLRRETVGAFSIAEAHTLAEIEVAARAGHFAELLHHPGDRLPLPTVTLVGDVLRRIGHGQIQTIELPGARTDGLYQLRDGDGHVMGILRALRPAETGRDRWSCRAEKWLA
ncbi:MAG: tRNA pseudouridine(55) synthase TruB [Anaerolineales bacterium]|nr:tRNA pseudouridine(55) synthase TruB [Anaerolineales bacterium]